MPEDEDSGSDPSRFINACPSCEQLLDVSEQEPYSKIECPACREMIRVRTEFNHFKIEQQIGEGGMSRVFMAEDVTLGRQNALKILNRQFSTDIRRTEQFEREATITASISHPNVVKVYSVGHDQAYFYIAMELVAKGSLDELIQLEQKVDESKALKIGVEVARGLKAAHNAGLIHRDVKPGNILFADDGTAKIVDFGLALMFETDSDESGEIWATPYYVPPEKLDREPEDFRSDIYSLGATLFHALAGVPPFNADTTSVLELKRLKAKPVSLADYAPHVATETCEVVDRAMAARPGDRHVSYEELIEHLTYARKCVARGGGVPVRSALGESKKKGSAKMLWGVGGVVALAGAVTLALLSGGDDDGGDDGKGAQGIVNLSGTDTTIASRFLEARDRLAGGKIDVALESFIKLSADTSVPQPTLNWSRFNAGICLLLQGKEVESREYFRALNSSGTGSGEELDALFGDVARVMDSDLVVDSAFAGNYPGDSARAIALLAFGLKNWGIGTMENARDYLVLFEKCSPPSEVAWIDGYKKLAAPYLSDLETLATFQTDGAGEDYLEMQARFDSLVKTAEGFKVSHGLTKKARERLEEVRPQLAKMKARHERMEQERMATLQQAELEALRNVVREIDGFRTSLKFLEGARILKQAKFETEGAKQACVDQVYLWEKAGELLEQLVTDFNEKGYEGEIYRGTAAPMVGKVTGAEGDVLTVVERGRESTVTIQELTIPGLVKMSEKLLAGISDSDDHYRRREQIVAFTALGGLSNAKAMAAALAEEHLGFRTRWERMKGGGIPAGG